jgi:hypothetical protein
MQVNNKNMENGRYKSSILLINSSQSSLSGLEEGHKEGKGIE